MPAALAPAPFKSKTAGGAPAAAKGRQASRYTRNLGEAGGDFGVIFAISLGNLVIERTKIGREQRGAGIFSSVSSDLRESGFFGAPLVELFRWRLGALPNAKGGLNEVKISCSFMLL